MRDRITKVNGHVEPDKIKTTQVNPDFDKHDCINMDQAMASAIAKFITALFVWSVYYLIMERSSKHYEKNDSSPVGDINGHVAGDILLYRCNSWQLNRKNLRYDGKYFNSEQFELKQHRHWHR